MKKLLFSLAYLLILTYSTRAQENNYSFKESHKISEPAQLVISSEDGNIEVLSSGDDSIEVCYLFKRNNKLVVMSRVEIEKELGLTVIPNANGLKISVTYPKDLSTRGANNGITLSLKVYVPKQTACNLKTADGNISISGLVSDQELNSGDGYLDVSNVKGRVKGYTRDGNIRLVEIRGSADFNSGDGNILLDNIVGKVTCSTGDGHMKASNIRGELSLKTSDGHIEFAAIEGAVTAITSDGHIKGNVFELKGKLSLEAKDGHIEVAIPDRLGLDLNLRAESIQTSLKKFIGKSDEHSLQGKINGGGIPVEIKAPEGIVKLIYR